MKWNLSLFELRGFIFWLKVIRVVLQSFLASSGIEEKEIGECRRFLLITGFRKNRVFILYQDSIVRKVVERRWFTRHALETSWDGFLYSRWNSSFLWICDLGRLSLSWWSGPQHSMGISGWSGARSRLLLNFNLLVHILDRVLFHWNKIKQQKYKSLPIPIATAELRKPTTSNNHIKKQKNYRKCTNKNDKNW